jgi:hypothetical protein
MKYKAAICISGHLRSYKKANPSFKKFIDILKNSFDEVDIFLATWDKKEAQSSWAISHGLYSEREKVYENEIQDAFLTKNITILEDDFYNSKFSPLNYNLFSRNILETIPNDPNYFKTKTPYQKGENYHITVDERMVHNNVTHISKMLFLKQQSLILKRKNQFYTNKNYDLVFYSRPEIIYNNELLETINFKKVISENADKNYIYTNSILHDGYPKIKDKCLFGGELGMDAFMNAFSILPALYFNNQFPDGEFVNAISVINFHVRLINFDEIGLLSADSSSFLR